MRFYFRYVQGWPEESVSASGIFGSSIHPAVQFPYGELLAGAGSPDLDTLLRVYQGEWRNRDLGGIRFGKNETVDTLSQLAERVLVAFQESDFADSGERIVAVEETLRGEVIPGMPDLLARIDLVTESDDAVTVVDFKTSRSKWSVEQAELSGEQLLLYSELLRDIVPGKPLRLRFIVLTKTKAPSVEEFDVPRDPQRVDRTKRTAERIWRSIGVGHFWPSPSVANCTSCGFRKACAVWPGE